MNVYQILTLVDLYFFFKVLFATSVLFILNFLSLSMTLVSRHQVKENKLYEKCYVLISYSLFCLQFSHGLFTLLPSIHLLSLKFCSLREPTFSHTENQMCLLSCKSGILLTPMNSPSKSKRKNSACFTSYTE